MSLAEPTHSEPLEETRGRLLFSAFLIVVAVYGWTKADVFAGLVESWSRTQTYQHGFLVLPITLLLIWSRRDDLGFSEVRVEPFGVLFLFLGLSVGLVGSTADLQVLRHLSFVLTFIVLAYCLLGRVVCKKIAFPLTFMLFAVPVGDEFVPPLIDLTATIATEGLSAFAIPVYREGAFLETPGGRFEVARVCSGVRYLLASVTLAFLFAGMYLTTWFYRVLFVSIGVILPLLANGLRALGIIMLAHYSDMKIAVGVDHIIYGWLFFGLVIAILMWIGAVFLRREKKICRSPDREINSPVRANLPSSLILVPLFCLGLVIASAMPVIPADASVLPHSSISTLPVSNGKFTGPYANSRSFPTRLNALDGALEGSYADFEGHIVYVSVFYYLRQAQGKELINTENAVVDESVLRTLKKRSPSEVNGMHHVRELLVRGRNGTYLSWYWYDINGIVTTSALRAKAIQVIDRLKGDATPAALVVFTVPVEANEQEARATLAGVYESVGSGVSECLWGSTDVCRAPESGYETGATEW